MSELERNVEALVRSAALPTRPAEARARFLGALAAPRTWPTAAVAAILLTATLAAVFRRLEAPPVVDASKPLAQEPGWIALKPLGEDATIALKARLPARAARTPLVKIEGTVDLADRYRIFLAVHAETESYDGRRLRPVSTLRMGGYTQVTRGRIALDAIWGAPAPLLVQASLKEADQTSENQAAMKAKPGARDWRFRGAGWDDALAGRLAPALEEVEALAADVGALLKEVETACASEERWKAESPRLKPTALALMARADRLQQASLLSAAAQLLFYTARNLASDSTYFEWKGKEFQGPVSYHADKQKLKTFREEAWTFDALRRYAREAPEVAARELALWLVKDRRRAGPRPEHAELAKRTPWADRFGADADLDVLEAEIRR